MDWVQNNSSSSSSNNNTDPLRPPVVPAERAAVAASSLALLLALASFCRLVYKRIEVRHPVYALLLQSVALMTALLVADCAALAPALLTPSGVYLWINLDVPLTLLARQFHEVTWACVAHLRWVGICLLYSSVLK